MGHESREFERASFLLEQAIQEAANVTKLNLSNNNLKQLPAEFGDLINLTHLFVSNNCLSSLPTSFKQLKKLQLLDLSKNKLKGLSENIADLKLLERLYVEGNPLTVEEIRSLMELMEKRRRLMIDIAGKLKEKCEAWTKT